MESQHMVQVRFSNHQVFVVPLEVVNRHRAENYARHLQEVGLCRYDVALETELSSGQAHPEVLEEWAGTPAAWAKLEAHARLVRGSWRG